MDYIKIFKGYIFGVSKNHSDLDLSAVLDMIASPSVREKSLLSGRGVVGYGDLPKIGPVVLKQYYRGGLLGKINRSFYFKLFRYRPALEFKLLDIARKAKTNVPEPLAWIAKGSLFYSGWLLMREVDYQYSLAEASKLPEDQLITVLKAFAEQVELLINARIFHVDLHPGNVLVTKGGAVYIIDFDKARLFKGSLNKLRDRYLFRWRRAVIKHNLPEILSEQVCAILRGNFSHRIV